MFKKLFGSGSPTPSPAEQGPYRDPATNFIYQLLFCDRPEMFAKQAESGGAWAVLFAEEPDWAALEKLAMDETAESRLRVLAFNRLRAAGKPVTPKIHLATIVEVGLNEGLDVMAVFGDHSVRYINHTERMSVVEGKTALFEVETAAVLAASKPIVQAIGPWDQERRPPPRPEMVRLNFLVSDGLYFGEGPMETFSRDGMAGPLIHAAAGLLQKLVAETSKG
ncbi:hypothetical protein [Luteolibacter soli]|uniref:Uncharacterized protein n=1 Tax=Luteolibacter soli TaxID=3135280 RepID=A0ABU9ATR9_9BACT